MIYGCQKQGEVVFGGTGDCDGSPYHEIDGYQSGSGTVGEIAAGDVIQFEVELASGECKAVKVGTGATATITFDPSPFGGKCFPFVWFFQPHAVGMAVELLP